MQKVKTIFFGNGPYALIVFKILIEAGIKPTLLVTSNPYSDIANIAQKNDISVHVFESKKWNCLKEKMQEVDVAIVNNFGSIIPGRVLKWPKKGILNLHPSLLPRHRGAQPVVSEILAGDIEGGVVIIKMGVEMDEGPIVGRVIEQNNFQETADEIYIRRHKLGTERLVEILPSYLDGTIDIEVQDHSKATYSRRLNKGDGLINLDDEYAAINIDRLVRAYNPWPGVYFFIKSKNGKELRINIIETKVMEKKEIVEDTFKELNGLMFNKKNLIIPTNDDKILLIKKLKIAGKKEQDAASFINGYLR